MIVSIPGAPRIETQFEVSVSCNAQRTLCCLDSSSTLPGPSFTATQARSFVIDLTNDCGTECCNLPISNAYYDTNGFPGSDMHLELGSCTDTGNCGGGSCAVQFDPRIGLQTTGVQEIRFENAGPAGAQNGGYCRLTACIAASCSLKCETPYYQTFVDPLCPPTTTAETQPPETEAPETEAPETEAPETEAPETQAPETEAPQIPGKRSLCRKRAAKRNQSASLRSVGEVSGVLVTFALQFFGNE